MRDDEIVQTLNNWIEIDKVHKAKIERKKKKLKQVQDETKDNKQYRDNIAYRMGLKGKKRCPGKEI